MDQAQRMDQVRDGWDDRGSRISGRVDHHLRCGDYVEGDVFFLHGVRRQPDSLVCVAVALATGQIHFG